MALRAKRLKDVLIHLGIILTIFVLLVVLFFYVYLPYTTNHGETQTLPDLQGMNFEEVESFLSQRDLRYEVRPDSQYSEAQPPLAVLNQDPRPGSLVKENRKVYLTLNARRPPLVKMPRLIDGSLKNAEMTLENYGLRRGEIRYEPDLAENAVLNQLYQGKPIKEGEMIPQGSRIDLVVGDGLGNRTFEAPEIIGMPFDEAQVLIIGNLFNEDTEDEQTGSVMRQNPQPGQNIRVGENVYLWIGNLNQIDSLKQQNITDPNL